MPAKAVTPATRTVASQTSSLTATKPPKKRGSILKFILFLLLTIALLIAAVAGAVHYNVVDLANLDSQWGISKYPIVGKLFKPSLSDLPLDEPEVPAKAPESNLPPILPKPQMNPQPVPVDNTLLIKHAAQQLEAEQRRIAKVSRLYDGMKPEEAAPILNELDDETVLLIFSKMDQERVGKIMTLLEAKRSARLSTAMLKGRVPD